MVTFLKFISQDIRRAVGGEFRLHISPLPSTQFWCHERSSPRALGSPRDRGRPFCPDFQVLLFRFQALSCFSGCLKVIKSSQMWRGWPLTMGPFKRSLRIGSIVITWQFRYAQCSLWHESIVIDVKCTCTKYSHCYVPIPWQVRIIEGSLRFGRHGRKGCYNASSGDRFWDQGSIIDFLDQTEPGTSSPMVSQCNKASKSKAMDGIQTDGYFLSAFQRPEKKNDKCPDKKANLYLPFDKQLDHGQVLVNFMGDMSTYFLKHESETLSLRSAFKFYGLPDSGTH